MPYVLMASRRTPDGVDEAVAALTGVERGPDDAVQGVLAEPEAVVDAVLHLVRAGGWTVGVGAGPAFPAARRALEAARRRAGRLAVRGVVPAEAGDAQAVLSALAAVVERRSDQAWAAIALVRSGRTQAETAAALGISRQAVGQRLAAGLWELERELRPTAARLLERAAG